MADVVAQHERVRPADGAERAHFSRPRTKRIPSCAYVVFRSVSLQPASPGGDNAHMAESTPPSDRRTGERHLACFPAGVARTDGALRPSVIHDLSASGALLLIRTSRIAVGDEIRLDLYFFEDATKAHAAVARVVRIEEIEAGEAGPWRQRVAVQFVEPLTEYAGQIERFQEVARRVGIT
jgi:hypothetical protein